MKKFWLMGLMLLVAGMLSAQDVKKIKIGDLETYIRNSDHPLVVSFWATWCAPCVEEIPWLQEAVEKHKQEGVELVLVSLDFANYYPEKLTEFIRDKKFAATFFWLDETNADMFCPKIDARWDGAIPVTLLVNNKTGYRKFVNRQLTDRQVGPEIALLVSEEASR